MGRNEWTALGLLAATFLGGAALAGSGAHLPWFIARASGLAAFGALTLSMVLGLLVTTKAAEPRVPRIFNFEIHSFVSVLALTLICVHVGSLLFDASFHFTPLAVVLPFMSPYAPVWTGLGVIAAWLVAIVTGSFWAKKRIGHKTWRKLHYISFAAYALSLVHGLSAGTDSSSVFVYWFYWGSVMVVASLLVLRVAGTQKAAARKPVAAHTPAQVAPTPIRHEPRPAVVRNTSRPTYQSRGPQRKATSAGGNRFPVLAAGLLGGAGVVAFVALSPHSVATTAANVASGLSQIAPARTSRAS